MVLLLASLTFYAWAKPVYLILLTASVMITWFGAKRIGYLKQQVQRKRIMVLTVVSNVIILVVFKYLGFFNEIIDLFVSDGDFRLPELLLPVGISFYTFQSLSYVFDVYFKIRNPEPHFGYYFTYVSFFPQILSGPISRADELIPQLKVNSPLIWTNIESGLVRFCWGLFKKLVIADRLGGIIENAYNAPGNYQGSVHWFVAMLYAVQLYADFSGYTDMAIGSARIFGIRLPENFNFPYLSLNITEFWRRWHLSLSNWLRDYIYTPIMFSKKRWGKKAVVYAIFITFLICGLWHGAKFTFVIFGILQGSALAWELLSKDHRDKWKTIINKRIYNSLSWLFTFLFICFCFIFFRAATTSDALLIAERTLTSFYKLSAIPEYIAKEGGARVVFSVILALLFLFVDKRVTVRLITAEKPGWQAAASCGVLIALIMALGVFGRTDFIYFKF